MGSVSLVRLRADMHLHHPHCRTTSQVLYQYTTQQSPNEDYSNFGYSLLMVWEMVVGGNYNLSGLLASGAWVVITLIVFSVFMFVTQILLLNMLIALMRDIYVKVGPPEGTGCMLNPAAALTFSSRWARLLLGGGDASSCSSRMGRAGISAWGRARISA